jgi:hypothetical protein
MEMASGMAPKDREHIMFPHLNESDEITFVLEMFEVKARVISSIYLTMAPIDWKLFDGAIKYSGAIGMVDRKYIPMAIVVGMAMRFAHPGDLSCWFMMGELKAFFVNGEQRL